MFYVRERVANGGVLEIGIEKYSRWTLAQRCILALYNIESLFSIIAESFLELERFLLVGALEVSSDPYQEAEVFRRITTANVRVMALLSAIRAYHDQRDGIICEENWFSKKDRDACRAPFSEAYDACFEYRMLEQLRNYTQHHALPIQTSSEGWSVDWQGGVAGPDKPHRSRYALDFYFDKEEIQRWSKLKSSIRDELSSRTGTRLDAKAYLRVYIGKIAVAHTAVSRFTETKITDCEAMFEEAANEFRAAFGRDGRLLELLREGEEQGVSFIGGELIDRLKLVRDRRKAIEGAGFVFVSSQIRRRKDVDYGDEAIMID